MANYASNDKSMSELVKHLTLKLRTPLIANARAMSAFQAALDCGMISVTSEYKLEWHAESKTLLAYFCGRIWCDDRSSHSKRTCSHIWEQSSSMRFPCKDLVDLFDVQNLRTLREQRNMGRLPIGWELVDALFGQDAVFFWKNEK